MRIIYYKVKWVLADKEESYNNIVEGGRRLNNTKALNTIKRYLAKKHGTSEDRIVIANIMYS